MQPALLELSTGKHWGLSAEGTLGSQKCKTDLEGTFQAKRVRIQLVSWKRDGKKAESLKGTEEEIDQQTPSECRNCKTKMRLAKTQAEL